MPRLPLRAPCALCESPYRRLIDSELIAQISAGNIEPDILKFLNETFLPTQSIDLVLTADEFHNHFAKHPKIGMPTDSAIQSSKSVMLPSGEKIEIDKPETILENIVALGMLNLLKDPSTISINHVLRATENLARIRGKVSDLDELLTALRETLTKHPPKDIDTKDNPYAATSPVGKP